MVRISTYSLQVMSRPSVLTVGLSVVLGGGAGRVANYYRLLVGPRKLGQRLGWRSERCSKMKRALRSTLSSNPYRREGRGGAYCGDLSKVTSVISSSCSQPSPVKE
jgi:hypothetical protein